LLSVLRQYHFMIAVHEKKFPGVPIVICGTMEDWSNRPELDSQFTGTRLDPDPARTLDVALQLQPGTKQVIVVNGVAPLDGLLEDRFRKSFHEYENKFRLTYSSGLPMSSLLPQLSQTPSHTVILFGAINQDAAGRRFISTAQSFPRVAAAANAPIFVLGDVLVGQGSVGGYVISYASQGRVAGDDVMKNS
jgi:hypothetical protein